MKKMLDTTIEDFDFSVRTYNCLKRAKINTLRDIVNYKERFDHIRYIGKHTLEEIITMVESKYPAYRYDYYKHQFVLTDSSKLPEYPAKNNERPQGEWLKTWDIDEFTCDKCRSLIKQPTLMGQPSYTFCPNCGAKMRKGGAEE